MKIRVIVNPKAGAGSAGRKIPQIQRALASAGATVELRATTAPGDATELARQAVADGVELLAVVGGDGTLNEVSQAFVDDRGAPVEGPTLGLIPAGTGGDFRRTLGIEKDVTAAVRRLTQGTDRPIDLGVTEVTSDRGAVITRAFINIGSFGVSGKLDRIVNRSPKWMGGRAAFAIGAVRAMSTYRNAAVSVSVDGAAWYEGRVVVTAMANGRYFGGGMQVAPDADPGDGLLDVVVLGDLSFGASVRVAPRLYTGKHIGEPRVLSTRGTRVEALPLGTDPVYVDLDGETPGRLPLTARLLPRALRVRV